MAMIRCPECGREVSDKAVKCVNCGYPLGEKERTIIVESDRRNVEEKTIDKKKIIVIASISTFVIVILMVVAMNTPSAFYKRGLKALDAENYKKAVKCFERAGSYEDAWEKRNEAYKLFVYHEGIKCVDASEWEEAKAYFIESDNYDDSDQLIAKCDYQIALQQMEKQDYESAISIFETILDYEDSGSKINECNYLIGVKLEDAGELIEAAKKYDESNDYGDSDEKIEAIGKQLVDEGNYKESVDVFRYMSKKSAKEMPEVNYANGMISLEKKEYDDAVTHFEKSKGYKDAEDKYKEAAYLNGEYNFKKKLYVEAKRNYNLSDGYGDAKEKVKVCELFQAKQNMNEGRLAEAKNLLEEIDENYSYEGVEAKNLLEIINKNEKWMNLGGRWKSKSGQMKSEQKGSSGYGYYWHREIGEDDISLDVTCPIDDDGTVYIKILGEITAYDNYSALASLLETKKISINCISEMPSNGVITLDEYTSITVAKDKITVNYKKVDKAKDVYFKYTYSTNVTYIK